MKNKLTIDDVTKADWIIMRLLHKLVNSGSRECGDIDMVKALIYIGDKYGHKVLAQAVDLLRKEYNHDR
jgi:hypothetical protein